MNSEVDSKAGDPDSNVDDEARDDFDDTESVETAVYDFDDTESVETAVLTEPVVTDNVGDVSVEINVEELIERNRSKTPTQSTLVRRSNRVGD